MYQSESKELSSSDALTTFEICQNNSVIGNTMATKVGFIKSRPKKEITVFALGEDKNTVSHNNTIHKYSQGQVTVTQTNFGVNVPEH